MKPAHKPLLWRLLLAASLALNGAMLGAAPVAAAPGGSVTSAAMPSFPTPNVGMLIVVSINIDMSGVNSPDNGLGSFSATLDWEPAILTYSTHSGPLAGFAGIVNTANVGSGHVAFNGANASGATGNMTVLTITFAVVAPGTAVLDLEYSAMAAAGTFNSLLPILTVTDGTVIARACYTLTVAVSPPGGGITNPAAGTYVHPEGEIVAVTATPADGYAFDYWSGACGGSGSCMITMDADKTVTAHFAAITPGPSPTPTQVATNTPTRTATGTLAPIMTRTPTRTPGTGPAVLYLPVAIKVPRTVLVDTPWLCPEPAQNAHEEGMAAPIRYATYLVLGE